MGAERMLSVVYRSFYLYVMRTSYNMYQVILILMYSFLSNRQFMYMSFSTSAIRQSILEPHLDIHHVPSLSFPPSTLTQSYPSEFVPLLNILSDHLRTISVLIYQGIYPSSTKRGYILRKLIRYSISFLTMKQSLLEIWIYV